MALPIFQRTVVNEAGDIIPSAQVEVRLESSGELATVYSDRDGVTPLSNPFFADSNGLARFYANPDEYKINAVGNGQSIEWRYVVLTGTSATSDVTTSSTDTTAGRLLKVGDNGTDQFPLLLPASMSQKLIKTNSSIPAFTKTGNFTVSTSQQIYVLVNGSVLSISSGTAVSMPTASTGTDYAIWVNPNGTVQATNDFVTPPTTGSTKIGGFHYAPGGNATAQSGGNSTAQINEYSFWDLKYRPSCADPRGMTCVAGSFWSDIYLLNNNPDVNGTSSYGKPIADGSTPPIIPSALGGNGSTNYGSLTWFEAMSIAAVYGKSAFTQSEFIAATFGVTEATSRGSDPVNTGLDAPRTSRWGVMQATGNLWTWAADRGGPFAAASWNANTEGFGSEYNAPNASLLGARWLNGSTAGSRSSAWYLSASDSSPSMSLRLRADHLQLD